MVNRNAKELGELLGKSSREGQEIKDTGFGSEQYGFNQITAFDDVKIPCDSIEVYKQLIGDALILGHPVNGKLGTSPYTLGETDLGARSKVYVTHADNCYVERFGITRFIDTSATTATVTTSSFNCVFADGTVEALQTSSIFYDNINSTQVSRVTVQLTGTGLANLQVSAATNGSTFVDINQNEDTAVTAGSDLRIKIRNDNADPATLTELKVVYELQ